GGGLFVRSDHRPFARSRRALSPDGVTVSANVGGALVPRPLVKPDPHSRNLRLHRLSDTSATFFITKSLLPKKGVLDEDARECLVSAFAFAVGQQRIY